MSVFRKTRTAGGCTPPTVAFIINGAIAFSLVSALEIFSTRPIQLPLRLPAVRLVGGWVCSNAGRKWGKYHTPVVLGQRHNHLQQH